MSIPSSKKKNAGFLAQWLLIKRMFGFMAPVKFEVVVTLSVFFACNGFEVLADYLLKPAVDIVQRLAFDREAVPPESVWSWLTTPGTPGHQLFRALIWLAVARAVFGVFVWAKTYCSTWQSMRMVFFMREAVYDRLQRVGFSFYDQHSTGQLINRALNDLQNVRHFVIVGVQYSLDIVLTVSGYFGVLLYRSPMLAAYAACSLPVWFVAIRFFAIKSRPIYEKQMAAADGMVQTLTENIAGVHVVRAFATEDLENRKFGERCHTLLSRLLDGARLQQFMTPTIRGIATATNILLFSAGAILVQGGKLNLGDLVFFGVAMNKILSRLQQINAISDAYQKAVVSSGRFFEILDHPDATPQLPAALPLRPGGGAVKFSHVYFGYEPGKQVLEDINFTAHAGAIIALVGPTGSGKTTMAALLARFYDPELGGIEIDGQDIREVTLQSVREAIGYVFQETYLFSDTVARNIAYSDKDAPLSRIKEAAHIAQADEFIDKLPGKYDQLIGEYGATLSGGQRQRLAIARAILHNPRILVLDDSLSAVDPETEAQIRAGLEIIMQGRTVFLITSRISSAKRADYILVIEDGKITQRGKHDELLHVDGYYRSVARSQFSEEGARHPESHMDRIHGPRTRSGRVIE
ncbi:MAG TPA: ABC transporter ATP-binding protein [Planctomycetota bacterium]|nr:ABC transporter ATP-binding protein [Planctomycetota bacterium]